MLASQPESLTSRHDKFTVIYRSEEAVTEDEDCQLRDLLFSCFSYNPVFLARRYLRKRPGHRWMVRSPAGEIVAHAALHEKTIGTETGDLIVGGVAEVCVASHHRGLGLAKEILRSIDQWLEAQDIAFALLFGDPRVYASSGYIPMQNELRTSSLLQMRWNPFRGEAMVKGLSENVWPSGIIDLRGPTF